MTLLKAFRDAQASYDPKNAKSVDAFTDARAALLNAGFDISNAAPKEQIVSQTARCTGDVVLTGKPKQSSEVKSVDFTPPKPEKKQD